MKLRLQPIRVFCFHQVSDTFDESAMERIDWLSTSLFKQRIDELQNDGYTFISLTEAHEKLRRDWFRCHKYAVLTADDGWATLKNVLPWLNEQQIPITLFLNPAYLDGKHYRDRDTERYLTNEEVAQLYDQYPLLTIGSHGWAHVDVTKQTEEEFVENVNMSVTELNELPNYVPYFAYTWGRHTSKHNQILRSKSITPIIIRGGMNYNKYQVIDREMLQ